ncbi:MAG TPA: cupredoxin domain-containing protein [Pseudomonadales bacterium]
MVILINLLGLLLIAFIVWWFWIPRKTSSIEVDKDLIEITVDNGVYTPAHLQLEAGKPVTLRFLRKDSSPCAALVVFDELELSEELPIGKTKDIVLTLDKPGKIHFACQMKMYRGDIAVV